MAGRLGSMKMKPSSLFNAHKLPPTSAYVHLPFCRKRCHYCDFPIIALGSSAHTRIPDPLISSYVNLLRREVAAALPAVFSGDRPPLDTVYFGGGTPSLVPPPLVASVLELLRERLGLAADAEVSMEMDPGTFDPNTMSELLRIGVNRVSLGVQAFQEELLRVCGRAHGSEEIREAIRVIRACGVVNWSMDLICSLPNQTAEMWGRSLLLAVEADPAHVSVYDLQLEKGTKFDKLYRSGESPLPSEEEAAEFYEMASALLAGAGYEHYEISSYSRGSGFRSRHNLAYWTNRSFYGFGLGSCSYLDGSRFARPRTRARYAAYVRDLEAGVLNPAGPTPGSPEIRAADAVMLALRTSEGLQLESLVEQFGARLSASLCKAYAPHASTGRVIFMDRNGAAVAPGDVERAISAVDSGDCFDLLAAVRLSDPAGFLLSNELISTALLVLES